MRRVGAFFKRWWWEWVADGFAYYYSVNGGNPQKHIADV